MKDIGVNLVALPLQTFHALYQGVSDDLRIREQHTLAAIIEFKVNSEQMFMEKAKDLKEKEELKAQSQGLETTITQMCNSVPELNIMEDATTTT